jgi:sugar phosphate isomerase/epimerase
MAAVCARLGTGIITLCTGTRDPQNMWTRHPDNDTPEAWRDLLACLAPALALAEQHDLTLAFEPEVANVIDTAAKGRRLLDEVRSPRLKVVLDAANLFRAGDLERMPAVLQEAFDQLGGEIVIAHAKIGPRRRGRQGPAPACSTTTATSACCARAATTAR